MAFSDGFIVLGVVGIVLMCLIGCLATCCCCLAVPIWILGSRLFSSGGKTVVSKSSAQYQMVDVMERNDNRRGFASNGYASAPEEVAEPIAEAYLVPPLVTVHTDNSEIVLGAVVSADAATPLQQDKHTKTGGFRDIWAAILFAINFIVIVWFAVQAYLTAVATKDGSAAADSISTNGTTDSSLMVLNIVLISCAVLAFASSLLGSLWLSFLMNHAERLIEFVLYANIAMLGFSTVACLVSGQIIGAIIFGLLTGLTYWYFLSIKTRIPFASAVIRAACCGIKANYSGLVLTAFGMMFCQMLWFLLWAAASYGIYQQLNASQVDGNTNTANGNGSADGNGNEGENEDGNGVSGWITFALLVSLYWGAQVVKGVVQVTVCGAIACWWFTPTRVAPVRGSLFRAVTTSFGSICFGSLIVAVIQAIKEMLHQMRNHARNRRNGGRDRDVLLQCVEGLAEWLLSMIESALMYFNTYAYCYVAAYGLDFMTSGKEVTALFRRRGWSAVINDNLIARTVTMCAFALTLLSALLGALLAQILNNSPYAAGMDWQGLAACGALLGGLMGLAVGMVLTNALESAVAMVFVSFAEDPTALQMNHSDEYFNLLNKWRIAYPETVEWIVTPVAMPVGGFQSGNSASPYVYNAYGGNGGGGAPQHPGHGHGHSGGVHGQGGFGGASGMGGGSRGSSSGSLHKHQHDVRAATISPPHVPVVHGQVVPVVYNTSGGVVMDSDAYHFVNTSPSMTSHHGAVPPPYNPNYTGGM